MKALYLTKYGNADDAFELKEIALPEPQPGEVRIKVDAFGLNFADVIARRGLYEDAPPLPSLLGYDVAGVIDQVGSLNSRFKKGDKVFALTRFGGYAEYVTTAESGVAIIPQGMDAPTATALATQAGTAYFCACESVSLHAGDKVLIQAAAGGVGTALVQIAKSKGCFVVGTASSGKQEYLKKLGVDLAIDYTKHDFVETIEKELGKKKIDVVFDSIGGKVFKKGLKTLAPGGRMVFFGAASQIRGAKTSKIKAALVGLGFGLYSPVLFIMRSQAMIGVNMLRIADHRPHILSHCLEQVRLLTEQGVIKPTISKVFPSTDLAEAHAFLESRKSTGKVAVKWI